MFAAAAERTGAGDLGAPADGAFGQGAEQEVAEIAAGDFGAAAVAVVGFLAVDDGVPVEDAHRLAAGMDERAEFVVETGGAECFLAGFLVDVEHAALGPRGR